MKVLVIGSGGREHALCWAIAASPLTTTIYCAPGNAGIAKEAVCVPISVEDIEGIVEFSKEQAIDFVVVGPEAPLVAGLVDALDAAGIKSFGPRKDAAQLEGSKAFTKALCDRHAIPTAKYKRVTTVVAAKAVIAEWGAPIVIKADGLAAGKGVVVAETVEQANDAVDMMLSDKAFGEAGTELVIEECLVGEEASLFALVDGTNALALAGAQDHKRVGDGDTGPNTGGMGAYSPAPILDEVMTSRVMQEIIEPTVKGMAEEGMPFKGVLYAGLMITADGPKLIEYNVRFGDPECQVLMARVKSDFLAVLIATADEQLAHFDLRWRDEAALTVVMASNGYPGSYEKFSPIDGVADAEEGGQIVFHAGTRLDEYGELVATGGRVLCVTGLGKDVAEAQANAYEAVDKIDWPGGFCRRDIGWRAIDR